MTTVVSKLPRNRFLSMSRAGSHAQHGSSGSACGNESSSSGELLGIVPMRNMVLFPGDVHEMVLDCPASIAAVQSALREDGKLGLLLLREAAAADSGPGYFHDVGTIARVLRCGRDTDESHLLTCHGEARFRVVEFTTQHPYLVARVEKPAEILTDEEGIQASVLALRQQASRAIGLLHEFPAEIAAAVQTIESPGALSDLVAGLLDLPVFEKQKVLETLDVRRRLDIVAEHLAKRLRNGRTS